jgi:hypothetical protein
LAAAIGFAAGTAMARDPQVNFAGGDTHFAGDCRGEDASLAGSNNIVTIRGACRAFQIAGGGNRVLVDMAPRGTIKVYGNNNQVSWTSSGDVEVTTVGPGNAVSRAH